jgi:hypothetical protein
MKTLIFTDSRKDILGKYAVIAGVFDNYELIGGEIPEILSGTATIKKLKQRYSEIDFTGVKLIDVVVIDKEILPNTKIIRQQAIEYAENEWKNGAGDYKVKQYAKEDFITGAMFVKNIIDKQ